MAERLDDVDWDAYYDAITEREPREEVTRAIAAGRPGFAIELGCGDGIDTQALAGAGWEVLAIDAEPASIRRVTSRMAGYPGVSTELARFEEITDLPPADLVVAAYTLPFCPPGAFDRLWSTIRGSLRGGGRFSGNFFGPNDTWAGSPGMTFHARSDLERLFDGFEIEVFTETDDDGEATSGPKHWHLFSVMATVA
jgi:SAM-dependent methyltransferase